MEGLPGRPISFWRDTVSAPSYPPLAGALTADVAVVGGGIVGVTAAYALKKAGLKVCLLENRTLGSGTTGRTTAKVTSLHGLIYRRIAATFGDEKAALYGRANQEALDWVARTVAGERIDCDLLRLPAFTFTSGDSELRLIEEEVEVARRLGLPASFVAGSDLPVPAKGAIRFDDQGQFHPLKYLYGLAETIPGDGSAIYEQTRALHVDDGRPCTVKTNRGDIRADHVIVATHMPFLLGGFYFGRTHPESHPAIAYRANGGPASGGPGGPGEMVAQGMYLGVNGRPHSVRSATSGDVPYLISAASAYKTGHETKVSERFRGLITECEAAFGAASVDYRWDAHDYMPSDGVPYVGRLTSFTRNVYLATGFGGWGMTNGTAAALMLTELILGRRPEWMEVFDSTRKDLHQLGTFVSQSLETTRYLVGSRIIKTHGNLRLPGVKRACGHLGCIVSWNDADGSWDCPCHGSRYQADGQMLTGPTTRDLKRFDDCPRSHASGGATTPEA